MNRACGTPLSTPTLCKGSTREEERKRGAEKIFEDIMAEIIPDLMKTTDIHIQVVQ